MFTHHNQPVGLLTTRTMCVLLTLTAGSLITARPAHVTANEVDGFTEPFKTVNVAAVEMGTIKSIGVREGVVVEKGQVLARLDDELHLAILAIADAAMGVQGQLKSARAEVDMRRQRLAKLEALRTHGHARQEEVERARTDLEIAEAQVLSAVEQLEIKRLEHNKVQVQLNRRVIRAPIDGVVSFLHKDEGEFVAPNDPHVLELVCLDPLLATFNVPSHLAAHLKRKQKASVYLEDAAKWVEGEVAVIAPITDAESSTVRIKVQIANDRGEFRSGEHCTLQLKGTRANTRRLSQR